jgi:hypothetical protein
MVRLRVRAKVDISQGTPPVDISGVVKVIDSAGKEVWSGRISDRAGSTPFSKEYVLETVDIAGGDYDLQASVDLSNAAGRQSLSRGLKFGLSALSGPGLAVFDFTTQVQQVVTFTIIFTPVTDTYMRFAGAWVDVDYGPDFWLTGHDNLGIIVVSTNVRSMSVNVPAGSHKLYVRVSAPQGYQWDICVSANGANLGCRRTDGQTSLQLQIKEVSPAPTPTTTQTQPVQQTAPAPTPAPAPQDLCLSGVCLPKISKVCSGYEKLCDYPPSGCRIEYYYGDCKIPVVTCSDGSRYAVTPVFVETIEGSCKVVCYCDGMVNYINCSALLMADDPRLDPELWNTKCKQAIYEKKQKLGLA